MEEYWLLECRFIYLYFVLLLVLLVFYIIYILCLYHDIVNFILKLHKNVESRSRNIDYWKFRFEIFREENEKKWPRGRTLFTTMKSHVNVRRNIRCPHVLSFPYFLKILCTTIFPNFPIKNHWTMKNCFSLINLDTNIKIYSKYRCTIIYFQEYFWSIVLDFRFRILTITILQFFIFQLCSHFSHIWEYFQHKIQTKIYRWFFYTYFI